MAAVFLICGIPVKKFLALCWEDIDFSNHTVRINKQLKDNDSLEVVHLERTECDVIEEPKMAFEFLELQRQEQEQQQLRDRREHRGQQGQQERGGVGSMGLES